MAPSASKALVTRVSGGKASLHLGDIAPLTVAPHQVLFRVKSVAQTPTDANAKLSSKFRLAFGEKVVLGCDYVGIVEKLGDSVTSLKIGDRIGVDMGRRDYRAPNGVSSNDASTVPLAAATAWPALYSETCLSISRSRKNPTPVPVWGGSFSPSQNEAHILVASVGTYTIQLARKYSIPVVTVRSPTHFELCKTLGATHVFDYHDEDVLSKIKTVASNIEHVFDCVGSDISSSTASQAVCQKGGVLCTVRPVKRFTDNVELRVKVTDVLVWTVFLKDHQYKEFEWPASEADHNLGIKLFHAIPKWLEDRTLKTNTSKVVPGRLSGVEEGFQMHRDGKISGCKLVYEL
ncbi:related to C.carbonum toxD gene [Phialocephala subalpina]|uniref:Related to C.carbonum toxD protein n=1 Tax=Phialocephala subalpina TaxID=576137 RepID=A0A1L7WCH8_9HELO|nr:related to C.carbonum toxD gene [Phialocephala subalpina]